MVRQQQKQGFMLRLITSPLTIVFCVGWLVGALTVAAYVNVAALTDILTIVVGVGLILFAMGVGAAIAYKFVMAGSRIGLEAITVDNTYDAKKIQALGGMMREANRAVRSPIHPPASPALDYMVSPTAQADSWLPAVERFFEQETIDG